MSTHYKFLGVPRDASQSSIKCAYRELALLYHPDKGGDLDMFKRLTEAYTTLSDPEKRQVYDFECLSIASLFEDRYASSEGPIGTIQPLPVRIVDLCTGTPVRVEVARTVVEEHSLRQCTHCNGTGVRYLLQNMMGGFLPPRVHAHCTHCTAGYLPESIVMRTVRERVLCRIPSGCPPGMLFGFEGKGDQVPGSAPGDLVVCITCRQPADTFRIRTDTLDLLCTMLMSTHESYSGFVRMIVHPDGRVLRIVIPATTGPGLYTLPGMGMNYQIGNRCGHLCINLQLGSAVSVVSPSVEGCLEIRLDATQVYRPTRVTDIIKENNTRVYGAHRTPGCNQM